MAEWNNGEEKKSDGIRKKWCNWIQLLSILIFFWEGGRRDDEDNGKKCSLLTALLLSHFMRQSEESKEEKRNERPWKTIKPRHGRLDKELYSSVKLDFSRREREMSNWSRFEMTTMTKITKMKLKLKKLQAFHYPSFFIICCLFPLSFRLYLLPFHCCFQPVVSHHRRSVMSRKKFNSSCRVFSTHRVRT